MDVERPPAARVALPEGRSRDCSGKAGGPAQAVERDVDIMARLRIVIGSGNCWLKTIISVNGKRIKPFLPIVCTGKTDVSREYWC
jgi:hypothetical protein